MTKKDEKPKKDKKKKRDDSAIVEKKLKTEEQEKGVSLKRERKAGKAKKPTKAKESIKVLEAELATQQTEKTAEALEEVTSDEWDKRHEDWDSSKVFDDAFLNEFSLDSDDGAPLENMETKAADVHHCVHCGATIFPGQAFCSRCGAYISEGQDEHSAHAARTNKFIKASIIGILAFVALAIVVALLPPGHDLQPMYDKYCSEEFATISEGGSQLMIDTNPEDEANFYNQDAFEAIEKVNKEIGLSAEVATEMKGTSGGEGTQRVAVHDVEVMWSYHPDRGLEVVYTVIN